MKILHTADWHIGRVLNGFSLLEDQQFMLDQLLDYMRDSRPDALVIAGDIYDRSVPPEDAVTLLDSFLTEVIINLKIPTLIIAGNHDGLGRLSFGSAMLEQSGLHVAGKIAKEHKPIVLKDEFGDVCFHLLPFMQPKMAQAHFNDQDIHNHDDAMKAMVARALLSQPEGVRSVVVAHAFVTGCSVSDSERSLTVGGTEEVSADHFRPFDYAALGHLHGPQQAGAEHIRYSGSLLKYSFSEEGHNKGFTLITLNQDGFESAVQVNLASKKDLRTIKGSLETLLAASGSDDYLRIHLTDTHALLDPMGRLREVYPNVMELKRDWLPVAASHLSSKSNYAELSPLELFKDFYAQTTEEEMTVNHEVAFAEVVDPLLSKIEGGKA